MFQNAIRAKTMQNINMYKTLENKFLNFLNEIIVSMVDFKINKSYEVWI